MIDSIKNNSSGRRAGSAGFLLGIISLYAVSAFFPDSFLWGVNHLAFLPPAAGVILLALALASGLLFLAAGEEGSYFQKIRFNSRTPWARAGLLVSAAAACTAIFYFFRVRTEMYGDTITLLSLLAEKQYSLADIFEIGEKEPLTRLLHQTAATVTGWDQKSVFQLVSSVSGGIYVAIASLFIAGTASLKSWKVAAAIILASAGANQLFFGHVEDYTLIYLAITLFFILAWKHFDGKRTLGWMAIVFIVGLRLHVEMVLLFPALLYAFIFRAGATTKKIRRVLGSGPAVLSAVVISVLFFSLLYQFYFDAYRYGTGDQKEIMTKIFLPVVNPLPGPHAYSLFSLNHLSDFVQQLFFTSGPAFLLLLFVAATGGGKIHWGEPRIRFFALAFFYFLLFNFTVNPMLSMPRDWDMLSPAAAAVNFLALAVTYHLLKKKEGQDRAAGMISIVAASAVLSGAIFSINSSEAMTGRRLLGIGKWVYKSYYNGSAYIINMGERMIKEPAAETDSREKTIADLLPYSIKPDYNISMLYYKAAVAYYRQRSFDFTESTCLRALEYDDRNASAVKLLGLAKIQGGKFREANNLFSFYNRNVNSPRVNDPDGIELERLARDLEAQNGAEGEIRRKLDHIYKKIELK